MDHHTSHGALFSQPDNVNLTRNYLKILNCIRFRERMRGHGHVVKAMHISKNI